MTLKRYNEILIAVVGTGFAIVCAGALVAGLISQWSSQQPETGVVLDKAKAVGGAKLKQRLELCMPSAVSGAAFQYFPVAGVAQDSGGKVSVGYSSYDLSAEIRESGANLYSCKLRGMRYAVFNVLVRNSTTNEQHLLLDAPAQVDSLTIPDEKCADGIGGAPCDTLIWGIRNRDNNMDGVINSEDSLRLYASGLDARELRLVSPENSSVREWNWDHISREFIMQVRRDSSAEIDSSEMLTVRVTDFASITKIPNRVTAEKLEKAFR